MTNNLPHHELVLTASPLRIPLKSTVRHAAASRKSGESVWVEARRANLVGFGEGCPRSYVTGETAASCRAWLSAHYEAIVRACVDARSLVAWVKDHPHIIDASPSMWCAIEGALLDLFGKEQRCSVESLLGLAGPERQYGYTAVLSDDSPWKTSFTIDYYLVRGFRAFKVKLLGNFEQDRDKLRQLAAQCKAYGIADPQIRLDANNLWPGQTQAALHYLRALDTPFWAIEEPGTARDANTFSQLAVALDCAVILDESLCTRRDLDRLTGLDGTFVGNIKVSKVGGLVRSLELLDELKQRGYRCIVGAHVGETSVLTRAGMLVAGAAGDALLAHEGGFGTYLLERDPAEPSLKFGHGGVLDLRRPYLEKTDQGLRAYAPKIWQHGWGLDCLTRLPPPSAPTETLAIAMPNGYLVHHRVWGPSQGGDDAIIVLHGGMSHSEWQTPLAEALRSEGEWTVIACDRRGCGLNEGRGDLGTVLQLVADVVATVRHFKARFKRVHLAGWCQGAQFATVAANALADEGALSSLILLTPGYFWNDRFRSVIDAAERSIFGILSNLDLEPPREEAFVPIPMRATDFTFDRHWIEYIENDPLKTTKLTLRSVMVMDEIQEASWAAIAQITLPLLVVLASNDRIVDNRKASQILEPLVAARAQSKMLSFESPHAVHFDKPQALARAIHDFLRGVDAPPRHAP